MAEKKNIFMNWVSKRMVHASKNTKGETFYNVSFPYAESATGFASVSVSAGQVLKATKKDGTENANFASILLGAPDKEREVSVCTDAANKDYKRVKMTNAEIADAYEASRKAYKESRETAAAETAVAAETVAAE